eukprot:8995818-Pyramimonas_sp.AAC.1
MVRRRDCRTCVATCRSLRARARAGPPRPCLVVQRWMAAAEKSIPRLRSLEAPLAHYTSEARTC